jgi:Ankyrin repeats (many copies)
MSYEPWGPPRLETPTSVPVHRRISILVAISLAAPLVLSFCQSIVGYMHANRGCGAPPKEIRLWAWAYDNRGPEGALNLQLWIARHPHRINKPYGEFCDTPLHYTARFGREDLAELLIAAGADVEARNGRDERPLHVSATRGRPTVVTLLLARRADVDARGADGKTPLHVAALGLSGQSNVDARLEVTKLLLAAGANTNARDDRGFTPLRYALALEGRNTPMADLLLAHGGDPRGAEGRTPAPATRAR